MIRVSIVGRGDHSHFIANEYEKRGILKEYYNFYYYKNNTIGKLLKKINPNIEYVNKNTIINPKKVKNFLFHKIIHKLLSYIKTPGRYTHMIMDMTYDLYVSIFIKEADYYHLWSQYSYFTIKKIRRKFPHAKILLDVYCALPNYRRNIYKKNPKYRDVKIAPNFMIKRVHKEILMADKIVCPTEHIKDSILFETKIPNEKIIVSPFGLDIKNFYRDKSIKKKEYMNILYVGQISPQKGLNYLIDVISNLRSKKLNITLTLIGKNFFPIEEYNFQKYSYIDYLGTLANNKLNKYYNSSHLYVQPSLSDAWGLAACEAIAAGLPVITTKNAKAAVIDGYNGIIIEENSREALEKAIKKLYENPNLLKTFSKNSKALLEKEKKSWDDYFKKIEQEFFYISK